MNFDEQKLKGLDNIRLNDNQYENVNPKTQFKNLKNAKKLNLLGVFFCFKFSMSIQCRLLFYFSLKLDKMIHATRL